MTVCFNRPTPQIDNGLQLEYMKIYRQTSTLHYIASLLQFENTSEQSNSHQYALIQLKLLTVGTVISVAL